MNKGVICGILPDNEMPRDPNGKVFDIIANPMGVPSRKNAGQNIEMYTTKIVQEVNNRVQTLINEHKYKNAINEILKMNELLQSKEEYSKILAKFKVLVKDKERFKKFIVEIAGNIIPLVKNSMSKISLEKVRAALVYYNIPEKSKIYDPFIGGKAKKKVGYGYIYWCRTKHDADKGLHARSLGARNESSRQATKGSRKEGGQRIGELDMFGLVSYDVQDYLKEIISLSSDDVNTKYEVINKIHKEGKVFLSDLKNIKPTAVRQLEVYLVCMGILDAKDYV